jgi:proline iminopeptidase
VPDRYPCVEPYEDGLLEVGDGQLLYREQSGNPDGKPAVVLHGGPGSG